MNDGNTIYETTPADHALGTGPVTGRALFSRIASPATDPATERSNRIWSAGEYDRIAAGFREGAREFVVRQGLEAGQKVLDAACGSGNLTIPAARTGARVTGFDLIPALLEVAAIRAAEDGLSIRFDQGTVEDLPYEAASFDVVLSMFGVMFAAAPERVVAELTRVTRPGGRVALANWTPAGFIGQMLRLHVAHAPPPAGAASPLQWGDESVIQARFDDRLWDVTTTPRTLTFRYPHTPAGTAELFRATYGPTVRTFEVLDEDTRAVFAAELAAHWTNHNRGATGTTEVESEYLEVIATRR